MRVKLLDIGTPTPAGNLYTEAHILPHLQEDSNFMKRLRSGRLLGEAGNPRIADYHHSIVDYVARTRDIMLSNVCVRISDVELNSDGVFGTIEPYGPKAALVQEAIDNGSEIKMSMRSISRRNNDNTIFQVNEIITFDYVA